MANSKQIDEILDLEIQHALSVLKSEDREPTHQELMWIRRLVKDNGGEALPDHPDMKLLQDLPTFEDPLAEEA